MCSNENKFCCYYYYRKFYWHLLVFFKLEYFSFHIILWMNACRLVTTITQHSSLSLWETASVEMKSYFFEKKKKLSVYDHRPLHLAVQAKQSKIDKTSVSASSRFRCHNMGIALPHVRCDLRCSECRITPFTEENHTNISFCRISVVKQALRARNLLKH